MRRAAWWIVAVVVAALVVGMLIGATVEVVHAWDQHVEHLDDRSGP